MNTDYCGYRAGGYLQALFWGPQALFCRHKRYRAVESTSTDSESKGIVLEPTRDELDPATAALEPRSAVLEFAAAVLEPMGVALKPKDGWPDAISFPAHCAYNITSLLQKSGDLTADMHATPPPADTTTAKVAAMNKKQQVDAEHQHSVTPTAEGLQPKWFRPVIAGGAETCPWHPISTDSGKHTF